MATTVTTIRDEPLDTATGVETPRAIRNLGIGQFAFATLFVIWLLFWPDGGERFAWPVTPRLTAVFIGTSFILRAFLGLSIVRTREWYRLRWVVWGNYLFLAIILIATFWHVAEMSWSSDILIAHIWILIYIFEPLILPFLGPFDKAANAAIPADAMRGPLMVGLKRTLIALVMVGATLAGLFFISPEFMTTRWPFPVDPFNARIIAAWPGAVALWAATLYFVRDWAEAKIAIQGFILYGAALFTAWVITLPQYDMARNNVWTYGIFTGVATLILVYYYWQHERRGEPASA